MENRNVGGRVAIQLNNRWFHPVADVEVEGSGIEPESVTNQDGSIGRSVKPKPYRVKLTIRDAKGLDVDALMETPGFDCTVQERDMKRTVYLTNAFAVGTPSRNTTNGEISGITIESDQYKVSDREAA